MSYDRGFQNALKTNKILQVGASKLVCRLYVGLVLMNDCMAVTLTIPRHSTKVRLGHNNSIGLD